MFSCIGGIPKLLLWLSNVYIQLNSISFHICKCVILQHFKEGIIFLFTGSNECADESLCEHLCLMSPNGPRCVCKEGYINNTETSKCERTLNWLFKFLCMARLFRRTIQPLINAFLICVRSFKNCEFSTYCFSTNMWVLSNNTIKTGKHKKGVIDFFLASQQQQNVTQCNSDDQFLCKNKRCINRK